MPLALLTMPIRNGLWNLIAQNALSAALLIAGVYAAARRLRDPLPELTALLVTGVLLIWPAPLVPLALLTTNQSYAPALGLAGLAFAAAEPRGRMALGLAVVLAILAAWLNAGVALLVTCIGLVALLLSATRETGRTLVVGSLVAIVAHRLLQFAARDLIDVTHVTMVPVARIPDALVTFWRVVATDIFGLALVPLLAVLAVSVAAGGRCRWQPAFVVLAGCVLFGSVMAVAFGELVRHAMPIVPVLVACAAFGIGSMAPTRWRPLVAAACAIGLIAAAQPRTPAQLRGALLREFGPSDITVALTNRVVAVAGDYWRVWPIVFWRDGTARSRLSRHPSAVRD